MARKCLVMELLFLLMMGSCINGFLDVFLSVNEVQRLLGLEAELYYIRNSMINNYALNFAIPVPSNIETLNFNWKNTGNKPISYSLAVNSSDKEALTNPTLNVSRTGLIPTKEEVFQVSLHCTGVKTAEINVTIAATITISPNNSFDFKVYRKKICLLFDNEEENQNVDATPIQTDSSIIFYYAVGCAFVLATSSVMCITAVYMRNNKHSRNVDDRNNRQQYNATFLQSSVTNTTANEYRSFRMTPNYYSKIEERHSKCLQERITELTIQRCRVCLRSTVLEGTFGRIYCGTYTSEGGVEEEVFVKTVNDHASQAQISLLLQEGMAMYSLNHPNILTILGVSFEDNSAPFLLYPYRNCSNLKLFLQKCKLCPEGVAYTLTTQDLVEMALQIIDAMNYLHKKNVLHKDLAARNCVVNNKLKVYIADNALSRDLFPSDYHCLGDNENRPIKWLALESLLNKSFTTCSDVWSFGVLLWELTTLAQQPYVEIDPFEMAAYLKDGYRLAQPINCPDELFAVMAYCWAMNPEERPTFVQLEICLKEFHSQLTRYV